MLTDYHLHLRPDDLSARAGDHFTEARVANYRAAATERGIAELGVSEHVYRFQQALAVWQHPLWREFAVDDLDGYCEFVRERTDLRLGIEADFVPGAEDRMANLLEARDFDFVVGSVHFLRDESIDMDDYTIWGAGRSPEQIWTSYFEALAAAARSGLFDILAHPDLVKVWGKADPQRPFPEGDLRRYYEPAIEAIAETGIAIEVSTAGLRKRVQELYPSLPFLAMCREAGAPVALSSDAHRPEDVGADYGQALELLDEVGYTELCLFERRARSLQPIGEGSADPDARARGEDAGEAGVRREGDGEKFARGSEAREDATDGGAGTARASLR
jgi:histidinol-phosphatase (PHP family)